MKTIITVIVAALLIGCARVPQTGIQFNPQTKQLTITSPKDVEIESATATTDTNGGFTIAVKGYKAKNNIEVLRAVTEQNAAMRRSLEDEAAKTIGTLIDLAK